MSSRPLSDKVCTRMFLLDLWHGYKFPRDMEPGRLCCQDRSGLVCTPTELKSRSPDSKILWGKYCTPHYQEILYMSPKDMGKVPPSLLCKQILQDTNYQTRFG